MITFTHTIQSPNGLHAMPCVNIVSCVINHESAVTIEVNGQSADGTDPIQLMALGGMQDDVLQFSIDGPDEEEVHGTLLRVCKTVL